MHWKHQPVVAIDAVSQPLVDNLCGIIWKLTQRPAGPPLTEREAELRDRIAAAEPADDEPIATDS